jgi:hypothetical protein
MKKTETAKRIKELERQSMEHLAGQTHRYHFADAGVAKITEELEK